MTYYREKLIEAVYALVHHGDLNLRLTYAAGCLIQIDDEDVLAGKLARFESVRDPLIEKPMVKECRMLARDFGPKEAEAAARGIVDLLTAEMGECR